MTAGKSDSPGVTEIAWALMRKWADAYDVPVGALNKHFEWAVELAKAYVKASSAVIDRQVGELL